MAQDFSLIPSIMAAGRAEIGYFPDTQIEKKRDLKDNLFFDFFPFTSDPLPPLSVHEGDTDVEGSQNVAKAFDSERIYYHHLVGGNTVSIFTLDPGFLDSLLQGTDQSLWL